MHGAGPCSATALDELVDLYAEAFDLDAVAFDGGPGQILPSSTVRSSQVAAGSCLPAAPTD